MCFGCDWLVCLVLFICLRCVIFACFSVFVFCGSFYFFLRVVCVCGDFCSIARFVACFCTSFLALFAALIVRCSFL